MLYGSLRPCIGSAWRPLAVRPSLARRSLLTLAIETSCDDTCVAILSKPSPNSDRSQHGNGAVLHFNEKVTSRNVEHGGIHPLIALDSHQANLAKLVDRSLSSLPGPHPRLDTSQIITLRNRGVKQKPDFISVTQGPGMRSNLACGLEVAKGLAAAWQIPLVGVHHMQAHALTPRLVHALEMQGDYALSAQPKAQQPSFPFLTLLISGGHTLLVHSTSLLSHHIIAQSRDIAVGDCLDKCGRTILPTSVLSQSTDTSYAKSLSAFAFPTVDDYQSYSVPATRSDEIQRSPNEYDWFIRVPLSDTRDLAFSFSSIISSVARLVQERPNMSDEERLLLARTALGTSFEHLGSRTILALKALPAPVDTLVASGGVAANSFLRCYLRRMLDVRGHENVKLVFPPVELCTDNAAMIAWAGMEMFEAGYMCDLGIMAKRKWALDELSDGDFEK